jgi:hypothetical protein
MVFKEPPLRAHAQPLKLGFFMPTRYTFVSMKYSYCIILFSLTACASPAWITYPVDQYLTVQLPTKPKVTNLDSMGVNKLLKKKTLPFQAFLTEGESGAYMIVVDASARVDSIPTDANRDSLYAQGIKQLLARANDNRLLSRTRFHTPAGDGVEFVMRVSSPTTHTPVLVFNRTLLAHHRAYTFTFTPYEALLDSTAHAAQRRRFFDSIIVKP